MIQMLVVIPRTILQTNVLNYLFPGKSSRERPGAAFPNKLATSSQAGSSAAQVRPSPSLWDATIPQAARGQGQHTPGRCTGRTRALRGSAAGHRAEAGPCGSVPGAMPGCRRQAAVQSLMAAQGTGILAGSESLPGPFPCSPQDVTASHY